jgi:flavin-dependent dehydrogenase
MTVKRVRPPKSPDYDIAVVGAGPAGSAAAATLAALGWQVLLVERDQFPRHKVCGEFLSPESQTTLNELGLFSDLAALHPVQLKKVQLFSQQGSELVVPLPQVGWGISRYAMDAALAQCAQRRGATLWQDSTATALSSTTGAHKLTIRRDGETEDVYTRAVLLAGGRAVAAKLLAEPRAARTNRLNVGIKAHYAGVSMPAQVDLYLFDGGYVGINPVESGAVNVCLLASYTAFAKAGRDPVGMIEWIAGQNPAFADRLNGAVLLTESICSVAAVDTGLPSRPWNGVACIGDAATMIPPLSGDGMAMALHAAALCVAHADAYLRGAIDEATWERRYTAEWHTAFDRRLSAARGLQALLNSAGSDLLIRAGRRVPLAADFMMRATRGTVEPVSFPTRPLS